MNLQHEQLLHRTRRQFLGEAGMGLGAAALASMMVYILMSLVLVFKPTGLFPPKG